MKILVCIKQVPDTNKVAVDPETGALIRSGVDSKMNPYDLYAIETAMRIKEKYGGEITVLSMGPPQAKAVIYEAFSMGADKGVLLSDRKFGGADVLATSYTLACGIARLGKFDLILCGKQTTDGDTAQVGMELSEFLSIPSVSNISAIDEITETYIVCREDLQTEIMTVKLPFPCLLTVEKGIYEPRLPSYVRKKETSNRTVKIIGFEDLEDKQEADFGLSGSPTKVTRIFPPEVNQDSEIWEGEGAELAERLYKKLDELKLI